jgi:hypothetical protein
MSFHSKWSIVIGFVYKVIRKMMVKFVILRSKSGQTVGCICARALNGVDNELKIQPIYKTNKIDKLSRRNQKEAVSS